MMRLLALLCTALILTGLTAAAPVSAASSEKACDAFVQLLQPVPHESLFQRTGPFNSSWFQTGAYGCQMVFVTSEQRLAGQPLPDLSASPGSPLYLQGWHQNPIYIADGPGTGTIGLEHAQALCLIYTEQPAWIDESGRHQQSSEIRIRVECMAGNQAAVPPRRLKPRR